MIGHVTAADLADELRARRSGRGYMARCPAHEDRLASLSISQGKKGTILNCHAGCSTQDICHQLGISMSQLFEDYGHNGNAPTGTSIDMLLRSTVRELEGRKEEYTLEEIMDRGFHAENHDECMARARVSYPTLLSMEFEAAYKMWVILADTAVHSYLSDYFNPDRMNWHEVRRGAMESLYATWRKETR